MSADQSIPKRRLRFNLRTLLAITTLTAIATWIYAVAWPWSAAYFEEWKFEHAARQLQAGVSTGDVLSLAPKTKFSATYTARADHTPVGIIRIPLKRGVYFVCLQYPQGYSGAMMGANSTSVEVYRVQPPKNDASHSASAQNESPNETLDNYTADFHNFYLTGEHPTHLSIEQLHTDPPTNAN